MSRYIIRCDSPEDITLGVKAIKRLMEEGFDDLLVEFESSRLWCVKKTKTGYSAKLVGEE